MSDEKPDPVRLSLNVRAEIGAALKWRAAKQNLSLTEALTRAIALWNWVETVLEDPQATVAIVTKRNGEVVSTQEVKLL